jgi:hypothetical protein
MDLNGLLSSALEFEASMAAAAMDSNIVSAKGIVIEVSHVHSRGRLPVSLLGFPPRPFPRPPPGSARYHSAGALAMAAEAALFAEGRRAVFPGLIL